MTTEEAARIQALASVAAVIVALVALGIAWLARNAAQKQAHLAEEAIKAGRRQMALSLVPFLVVDHPEAVWEPDSPYLKVTFRNAGPTVAYAIQASLGERPETALELRSGVLPALAPGAPFTTHVLGIGVLREGELLNRFRAGQLSLRVHHRSPTGSIVTAHFIWNPTAAGDERSWTLDALEIDPLDGGEVIRFAV